MLDVLQLKKSSAQREVTCHEGSKMLNQVVLFTSIQNTKSL
jgi:hypothetical protein